MDDDLDLPSGNKKGPRKLGMTNADRKRAEAEKKRKQEEAEKQRLTDLKKKREDQGKVTKTE
jgi:hypothetical protein